MGDERGGASPPSGLSLSLNLTKARAQAKAAPSAAAPATASDGGAPPPSSLPRQRKRRHCDDVLRSLRTGGGIPIPTFDFELARLERDFFGEGAGPDGGCDGGGPEWRRDSARTDPPSGATTNADAEMRGGESLQCRNPQNETSPSPTTSSSSDDPSCGRRGVSDTALELLQVKQVPDGAPGACPDGGGASTVPPAARLVPVAAVAAAVARVDGAASVDADITSLNKPPAPQLLAAIEAFLDEADPSSATANQCFQTLERTFHVQLKARQKSWVRAQLKRLLLKRSESLRQLEPTVVEPETSLPPTVPTLPRRTTTRPQTKSGMVLDAGLRPREPPIAPQFTSVIPYHLLDHTVAEKTHRVDNRLEVAVGQEIARQCRPPVEDSKSLPCREGPHCDSHASSIPTEANGQTAHRNPSSHHALTEPAEHAVGAGARGNASSGIVCIDVEGDVSSDDSILQYPKPPVTARSRVAKRGKGAKTTKSNSRPAAMRGRKQECKRCPLCTHCPCTFASPVDDKHSPSNATKTDDAIERGLMRQLQTLEKTVEKYEAQLDVARRKLKRHRREMWQKMMHNGDGDSSSRPPVSRFLPNNAVMNQIMLQGRPSSRVSSSTVDKSKRVLFSFAPNYQPTLTQMLGQPHTKHGNDDQLLSTGKDCLESKLEEAADDDEDISTDESTDRLSQEVDILPVMADGNALIEQLDEWEVESVSTNVLRIETRRGRGAFPANNTITDSSISGYMCQWDSLFDEPEGQIHLDELCNIFDVESGQKNISPTGTINSTTLADTSVLSQRGKQVFIDIINDISRDGTKISSLEASCPNWKENVCFAMQQSQICDLDEALQLVRGAQSRLSVCQKAILEAAERRAAALELYELALTRSMARLRPDNFDGTGMFSTNS